jgi:F-type H+-transporting ATPase subunit b
MLDFNITFIFTIINILFLYWILKKILFKPATTFMEKRANNIKEMFDSAQSSKEQAEAMKADLKKQLDNAIDEAEKIINDAKVRAEKQYEETLDKAKKDAKLLVEKAQRDIEIERKNTFDNVKAQIAGIALSAASKVIQKNIDTETNKKLVEQFIGEVGAA